MTRTRATARRLATALDRHHVPETLTALMCVGLSVLAIDMMAAPETYDRPSFAVAVSWAQPAVWGVALLAPCVATLAALAARRRDVYWLLWCIVVWLTAWSAAAHLSAADPAAVRSASIIYTLVTCISAILAGVYAREGRRP